MSTLEDFCNRRIAQLREHMGTHGIDVVCLLKAGRTGGNMFKRLVNTSVESALVIPMGAEPTLICSSMDARDADDSTVAVHDRGTASPDQTVIEFVNNCLGAGRKIGCNPSGLTHSRYQLYNEGFKAEVVDIQPTILPEVLFGPYPEELKYQRKASELADIGAQAVYDNLKPGINECELAAEAVYAMRKAGAEGMSFCIVNSGPDSAHVHGAPSDRVVEDGDLVLIDLGPVKHGYLADISRTFLVGSDPKKQHMLEAMDKSVQAVLDAIKPGESCKELDALSRRVLIDHGYEDYPHSLGHPVSGFVKPGLSKRSNDVERVGYVHTVEPGIYIPGLGGVRFEENVYVTEEGCESLFKSPRLW